MPRKPLFQPPVVLLDPTLDQQKITGAMTRMQADEGALSAAQAERETTVRAVAQQLGYHLPADCTDPDLILRDIAANMRRSVEACLEVGKGLRVLKAACPHGSFVQRLDALGIEVRVAQRFMQSAAKFSKAASTPLLVAAGNQAKLFELLVLDDEQIEELELTGQTGELDLDDVATMSVKELRSALREVRAEKDASDQLLAEKNKRIDQLKAAQRRIDKAPADEKLGQLQAEATSLMNDVLGGLRGGLRQALIALKNHGDEDHSHFMAGLVGQVQADLVGLRDEFALPDTVGDGTPEWQKWAAKQGGKGTPAH